MLVPDFTGAIVLAEKYLSCSVAGDLNASSSDALQVFRRGLSIFEAVRDDDTDVRGTARLCEQLSGGLAEKALIRQGDWCGNV